MPKKATKKSVARKPKPTRPALKKAAAVKAKPAARTTPKATTKQLPKKELEKVVVPIRPAPSAPLLSLVRRPTSAKLPPPHENSGLDKEELDGFYDTLMQKRAEILGDVTALKGDGLTGNRRDAAGDLSSMPLHPADVGSDNYEMEFTLGLIESERALLKEIEDALERIRNGTFGLCIATGKPIGKARLKARPWAKHSYEYALAQERGRQSRF